MGGGGGTNGKRLPPDIDKYGARKGVDNQISLIGRAASSIQKPFVSRIVLLQGLKQCGFSEAQGSCDSQGLSRINILTITT